MADHFVLPQLLASALFALSIALVIFALRRHPAAGTKVAALASLATIGGAGYFMLLAYAGEKPIEYDPVGPIKRNVMGGDRGYFEYEDAADGANSSGDAGSSSQGLLQRIMFSNTPAPERPGALVKDCPYCPELVVVQPGFFRMGAAASDTESRETERPSHLVRVGKPFAIGRSEITVAQYLAYLKLSGRPLPDCGGARDVADPRLPMTCVSWRDALSYTGWLSTVTGLSYRLPSEAQWEWAARGGSTGRFASGDELSSNMANIGEPNGRLHPVGTGKPNGYGLLDIHGNAAEIAADCWAPRLARIPADATPFGVGRDCLQVALRDAHSGETVAATRISARRPIGADERRPGVGFRVIRDLR